MSICLDIVGTREPDNARERRECTVRSIGEILPLVIARYGIDPLDYPAGASRDCVPRRVPQAHDSRLDYSI